MDVLSEADLDYSKAVQIYFDKYAKKEANFSSSSSLMQQFQNKFSLNISTLFGSSQQTEEKKQESIKVDSDHSQCIYCTPLNNYTTLQSLLTNKHLMRGPSGHLSAKHPGPWNKFYIQLVENKDILYETKDADDVSNNNVVTIKLLMNNCNEYLCVRFNKKVGTTFKSNIIFAHWRLIEISSIDKSQSIVSFQSMAFPNLAIYIDDNDDFKPSMNDFQNNIYKLCSSTKYQFKLIHQKPNLFNFNFMNNEFVADKVAIKFINQFAAKMNRYQQIGAPNINGTGLTLKQKIHFIQHGWVIIRGAINQQLLSNALGWINNGLGSGQHIKNINGEWICKEEKILNLYFKSNLYSCVRSILHENPNDVNNYDCVVPACQIALNFPLNDHIKRYWKKEESIKENGWHIDGMNVKNDNTQIYGFSLLCGVILSHWHSPYMGNFTVFDKSHWNLGNLIKNVGEHEFLNKEGLDVNRSNLRNKVIQIEGNVGDVIICHPYLAHLRGPNFSNEIRYAVFFRPYVMNHAAYYACCLEKDLFAECKGLTPYLDMNEQNNDGNVKLGTKSIFE